jgi:hypothetical protein
MRASSRSSQHSFSNPSNSTNWTLPSSEIDRLIVREGWTVTSAVTSTPSLGQGLSAPSFRLQRRHRGGTDLDRRLSHANQAPPPLRTSRFATSSERRCSVPTIAHQSPSIRTSEPHPDGYQDPEGTVHAGVVPAASSGRTRDLNPSGHAISIASVALFRGCPAPLRTTSASEEASPRWSREDAPKLTPLRMLRAEGRPRTMARLVEFRCSDDAPKIRNAPPNIVRISLEHGPATARLR